MTIIIVGGSGYIGKKLVDQSKIKFPTKYTSSKPSQSALQLDLRSPSQFDYDVIEKGDTILLSAAISAPDVCSNEFDMAWSINVTGTIEFIENVISHGGRVIFFSSDTVYGEKVDKFDETATSNPAGEYAEMKHAVEKRFSSEPSFKAVRLSYVFSSADKFTKYLVGCAQGEEEADLFHPFYRAIIHRDDVIEGVLALAERWSEFPHKVINFGGPEVISRVDFAECLKQTSLPNLRFKITQPHDDFFKNRPRTIAMTSDVLTKLLGRSNRTLKEAASIEFKDNQEHSSGV